MSAAVSAPAGFRIETRGVAMLLARAEDWEAIEEAGLDDPRTWERWTGKRASAGRAGRGQTATLELASGLRLRLKQLRRGGALAALWRERFPGARRLVDNVRIPLQAARRGVATPPPVVLLLEQGPPGLFRGWLGTEEIEGAVDLASRLSARRPAELRELASAMAAVRKMHDSGLDHLDLNLGNLLVQTGEANVVTSWICDLDGSRLQDAPVEFAARQRALRRLERSCVKLFAPEMPPEEIRDGIYRLYAAQDRELAERLERGRRAGRGWILLHRLGWRR